MTGQNLGGERRTDSDIDPTTGMSDTVTVAAGETNLDLDAGIYETASLGDRVWVDSNANGVQDAGEVGKAGVTVELYTCVGDMPRYAGGHAGHRRRAATTTAGLTRAVHRQSSSPPTARCSRPPTWATTPSIRTRVRTD